MSVAKINLIEGFTLLVLLVARNGTAQPIPGFINADNYPDANNVGGAPIYYWTGPGTRDLAPVEGTYVQVLGRPAGATTAFELLPNTDNKTNFKLLEPGYFDVGILIIYSVTGREGSHLPVEFVVRSWRGASSWEAAQISPEALAGQTPVFQDDAIANFIDATGPARPGFFSHITSFTLMPIPEPTVLGLGIVGGSLMFMAQLSSRRQRRKRRALGHRLVLIDPQKNNVSNSLTRVLRL
jgi:hypothetical protein